MRTFDKEARALLTPPADAEFKYLLDQPRLDMDGLDELYTRLAAANAHRKVRANHHRAASALAVAYHAVVGKPAVWSETYTYEDALIEIEDAMLPMQNAPDSQAPAPDNRDEADDDDSSPRDDRLF